MKLGFSIQNIILTHAFFNIFLFSSDTDFITRHLLPEGPMKTLLDKTFINNSDPLYALKKAGFTFLKEENQIVAHHPNIPEFMVKAIPKKSFKVTFFINNLNIRRIEVADDIRNVIIDNKLVHIIVPKKYLYHIPKMPTNLNDRNYIVVTEKFDLIDLELNQKAMKNLTMQQSEEIYLVIKKVGLFDTRCNNIVFTKQGKIAFIDTEPRWYLNYIPILSSILKKYLGKKGTDRFTHDIKRSINIEENIENISQKIENRNVELDLDSVINDLDLDYSIMLN